MSEVTTHVLRRLISVLLNKALKCDGHTYPFTGTKSPPWWRRAMDFPVYQSPSLLRHADSIKVICHLIDTAKARTRKWSLASLQQAFNENVAKCAQSR